MIEHHKTYLETSWHDDSFARFQDLAQNLVSEAWHLTTLQVQRIEHSHDQVSDGQEASSFLVCKRLIALPGTCLNDLAMCSTAASCCLLTMHGIGALLASAWMLRLRPLKFDMLLQVGNKTC